MNCNHEGIGEPGCYVCDPDKGRVVASLRAEVVQLKKERDEATNLAGQNAEWAEEARERALKAEAEAERLRGLFERAACLVEDADDGAPLQCLADAVRALGEVRR